MADNLRMARQGTSFYDMESGQNETQTITVANADGGNWTATFGGQTTANIAWNATAATVQTRLRALSTIGDGGCVVTGSTGGPYTVEFTGPLARTNVGDITVTDSTTGAGHAVTVAPGQAAFTGVDLAWGYDFATDNGETDTSVREIVYCPAAARSPRLLKEIAAGNIEETATAVTTKPATPWGYISVYLSRRLVAAPSNGDILTYSATLDKWVPENGK